MKEKNLLLKKNTFSLKRRRYSVLLSTSFILTLLTLFTLFFTRCDKDDYTGEVKGICPEVIVTDPVNGAINVSTNKVITATFNEPMQSATINESTFFVKNGVNIVSGHVTYSGTTATFTPASLLQANTVYTATVTRGATDPMGNVMRNDYTWSFNTGSLPRVILTDPVEGASDVKLDKAVTADFNTAMNAATVNSTSFLLKQGTTAVAGIVTYLGVKATFTPTLDLLPNKVYTATITNNVEDVAGNAMRNDTTWSFATGSLLLVIATDPLNGAVDVPYNKIVKATFNKLMNPATINNSTFTLMHGPTPVLGTVSYSEFTAEFTPLTDLLPGEEYTATITTGALDLSGNALIADYIWKFTTNVFVEPVLPVVLNTDPMDEAIDVPLDKVLKATFSKIMDPSSINSSTFTLMNGSTPVIGSINYSGVEATFSPITPLLPGTLYTATITTGAKDLEGNALADDYTWEFTTKDVEEPVLPVVISTDPVDEAIDVALYKVITATFSKTMDAATINASTFTVMDGSTSVTGSISYSGVVATFTPDTPLSFGTLYSATITTGAKDLAGYALADDYTWEFTTLEAPVQPVVINTDPVDEAINVALYKVITATFSKTMDAATINASTFTLSNGLIPVTGSINYSGVVATFTPDTPLSFGTLYTATITDGAKDVEGNALAADYTWEFTTVEAPVQPVVINTDPVDKAIDVELFKVISATFSKTMDAATINASSFTVMNGSTAVSGSINYSGVVATFTPNSPLSFGTLYTAIITTGAEDMEGYALAADYTWEFTTVEAPVLPVVINTDPEDEATGVALDKVIAATFSKIMNAATINASTFTLTNGLIPVTGSISYSGMLATFTPDAPLSFGTLYTATITNGAEDLEGYALAADYTWEFTTVEAPVLPVVINTDPEDEATGVALDKVISATFSKIMDAATINAFSFIVMNGLIPVTGSINYSGVEATFTPNTPLLPGTSYTATITTGAEDLGGNAMAANYEWSFTTSAAIQWTVELSSDPTEGGNTSGGGLFNDGASVTVLAEPNVGYSFEEWTENDVSVSTLESYTFIVSSNRTLVANFSSLPAGPAGIDLGSAADFAILAGAGVTNSGVTTIITGDVGSFPTATIVGLLSSNVNGILYTVASPIVETAKLDLTTAYNDAQSRSLDAIDLPGQLGGLKFAPGLYVNSSTSGISGTGPQGILTLDAGGNPNAVWIFKMGSTLITDSGTSIVLAGGAQAKNIYWSVGSSATLGTNSIFYGNILADQSITITNGATLIGRALTRIAAVTLEANTVTKPE